MSSAALGAGNPLIYLKTIMLSETAKIAERLKKPKKASYFLKIE
jgi:hypothetical protein